MTHLFPKYGNIFGKQCNAVECYQNYDQFYDFMIACPFNYM